MTDNVIHLSPVDTQKEPQGPTADELLTEALGKYQDVIIIGVSNDKAQCISSLGLDSAVYEVSRALHRLHCYIDRV